MTAVDDHLNEMAFSNGVAAHIAHDVFVGPLLINKKTRAVIEAMEDDEAIDFLKDLEAEVRRVLAQ